MKQTKNTIMSDTPKLERYVPKPGEPALPPQLSEFQNKSSAEVLDELNKMPFFMNSLPTDIESSENFQALEALRAMNYEGNPTDMITNFKNQGNDLFKVKNYKDARTYYQRGLDIDAESYNPEEDTLEVEEDSQPFDINEFNAIKAVVYSNKAACELSLKNYRKCINDCKSCLSIDSKNIKAYFRMAKAFMLLRYFDESLEAIKFGLLLDKNNKSLLSLLDEVNNKIVEIAKNEEKTKTLKFQEERKSALLEAALDLRQYVNVTTQVQPPMPNSIALEEEDVVDSQMIFTATIKYPTYESFDVMGDISEVSTIHELIKMFENVPDYVVVDEPKYKILDKYNNNKGLHVYMETIDGGLVKMNKKWSFHKILGNENPKIPLINKGLVLYFAAAGDTKWIEDWDREHALSMRV